MPSRSLAAVPVTAVLVAGLLAAVPLGAAPAVAAPGDVAPGAAGSLSISNRACTATVSGQTESDRTVSFTADSSGSADWTYYRLTTTPAAGSPTSVTLAVAPGQTASSQNVGEVFSVPSAGASYTLSVGVSGTPAASQTSPQPTSGVSPDAAGERVLATQSAPACSASARAQQWQLYRPAYTSTIYALVDGSFPVALDFATWSGLYGSRTPRPAPTDYVRYPWSPDISAVTFWGSGRSSWQWASLDPSSWSAAGRPAPRDAGWIFGSFFWRYATGSELFESSTAPVSGASATSAPHKLTFSEWQAASSPSYTSYSYGFEKTAWAPELAIVFDPAAGRGAPLDYAQWQAYGLPTPRSLTRIPGDEFYKTSCAASTIYYSGPQMDRAVTYREWVAAGSPRPQDGESGTAPCP